MRARPRGLEASYGNNTPCSPGEHLARRPPRRPERGAARAREPRAGPQPRRQAGLLHVRRCARAAAARQRELAASPHQCRAAPLQLLLRSAHTGSQALRTPSHVEAAPRARQPGLMFTHLSAFYLKHQYGAGVCARARMAAPARRCAWLLPATGLCMCLCSTPDPFTPLRRVLPPPPPHPPRPPSRLGVQGAHQAVRARVRGLHGEARPAGRRAQQGVRLRHQHRLPGPLQHPGAARQPLAGRAAAGAGQAHGRAGITATAAQASICTARRASCHDPPPPRAPAHNPAIVAAPAPRPCLPQLLRVDGVDVVNLGHAAALMEAAKGPFVKLELEWNKVCVRARAIWNP